MEIPEILIETHSYCNAQCIFCGHRNMKRKKGKMDTTLFKDIIRQIGEFPNSVIIKPVHASEFFLDNRWFDFLRYIDDNAPKSIVHIATNGSCLTEDVVNKLITFKTFKQILFSTYSFNPVSYKEITGLPVETLDLIKTAADTIFEKRLDAQAWFGLSPELITIDDLCLFSAIVNPLINKYGPRVGYCFHAITRFGYNTSYTKNKWFDLTGGCTESCPQPFNTIVILHDGIVAGCCFDVDGTNVLGDLKKERLIDILQGNNRKKFQQMHSEGRRKESMLCRGCSQPCSDKLFYSLGKKRSMVFTKDNIPVLLKMDPSGIYDFAIPYPIKKGVVSTGSF